MVPPQGGSGWAAGSGLTGRHGHEGLDGSPGHHAHHHDGEDGDCVPRHVHDEQVHGDLLQGSQGHVPAALQGGGRETETETEKKYNLKIINTSFKSLTVKQHINKSAYLNHI